MEITRRHRLCVVLHWVFVCSSTVDAETSTTDGLCGPRQLTAGPQPKYLTSPCYSKPITECRRLILLIQRTNGKIRCTFDITAKEGERVDAAVLVFDGKYGFQCKYDHVNIFDGIAPYSRQLNEHCAVRTNFTTRSSARYMRVELTMMFTVLDRGFKMMYTSGIFAVSKHVDLTAYSFEQSILSPGYPGLYGGRYHLTWRIYSGSLTDVIRMAVEKSDLPYNPDCSSDYLQVHDGYDSTSTSLAKWCGDDRPSLDSSGSHMFLEFCASGATNHGVFVIEYSCIKLVELKQQTPQNPYNPQEGFENSVTVPTTTFVLVASILVLVVVSISICSWKLHKKRRSRTSNTACAVMASTMSSNPVVFNHLPYHEVMMPSTGTGGETDLPPYTAVGQNQPPPSYDSLFGSNSGNADVDHPTRGVNVPQKKDVAPSTRCVSRL